MLRLTLTENEGTRIRVSDLFAKLREPPIGARDGLLPLMLAVFCVAEAQHIAMYEDDAFIHSIGGAEFHRLSKAPESFELQYCKLSGVRSEVFNQLLSVVDSQVEDSRAPALLDVVKPLCEFAAGLPDYSRNSTSLGTKTLAIRTALLNAKEPSTLIFEQLPAACGLPPVHVRKRSSLEDTKKYVRELKKGLGELRSAYPTLLACIEKSIAEEFEVGGQHEVLRTQLEHKAADLSIHITEPTLKAFCLRLADSRLARDAWLESVGSLVLAKPPRRWHDTDIPRFAEAIKDLVSRFQMTAALAFSRGKDANRSSMRVSILLASGEERACVVDVQDTKQTAALKARMEKLFDEDPRIAVAVASEIVLRHLSSNR